MSRIQVLSRTQRIVLNPNRTITVIDAGPVGPSGPSFLHGEAGQEGYVAVWIGPGEDDFELQDITVASGSGVSDHGDLTGLDDPNDHPWAVTDTQLTDAVQAEEDRATTVETSLASNISDETTRATASETALASDISDEIARATGVEGSLNSAIDTEESRAMGVEDSLDTAIDTEASARASAVSSEATARIAADTALQTSITDEVSARAAADTSEATARASADTTLTSSITAEAAARIAADLLLQPLDQKDQPNGYAGLTAGGLLNAAQLPSIAISDYLGTVASQAAMLALVGERGDWCIRSDVTATYILKGEPSSTLSNWVALPTPTDVVLSVDGRTGVVTLSDLYDAIGAATTAQAFSIQRGNHTGSQIASTISDLTEAVQDIVGAFATSGTRMNVVYSDVSNTLTFNVTGLVSTDLSDFVEAVQDVIGALASGGSGLTMTYNDISNTWVLDVNVDGSTLEINADTLRIKDKGVTLAKIADSATDSRVLGRAAGAGAGSYTELTPTQQLAMLPAASDTISSIVELATIAETTTGTDAARAVTPDGLAGSDYGKRTISIQVTDPNGSVLTVGDGQAYYRVPAIFNNYNLVAVAAHVTTVSSSGLPTIQIANVTDGVDILSTKITIDASEKDSSTAATAAVIDTSKDDVQTADELRIDIDVAGTGTKGLIVELTFQVP